MSHALRCSLLLAVLAGAPASAAAGPDAEDLGPVTVEGERTPLDSRRPEYDRQLPCMGCEGQVQLVDGILMSVLRYVLLPSEPPDLRDTTPISLQQPRNPRAEKLP